MIFDVMVGMAGAPHIPIARLCQFSPDRVYRYTLWREWDITLPYAVFIGLNPSTADEFNNDPTIRREIDFCKRWGFGALCKVNIFAYRATDPEVMKQQLDPIGPDNDRWINDVCRDAGVVVAAWGIHGEHNNRAYWVRHSGAAIHGMKCLGKTKYGYPKHPLYVPAVTPLVDFP